MNSCAPEGLSTSCSTNVTDKRQLHRITGRIISDVLMYGYAGQLPWAHEHRAPMLICACCVWQVCNCLNNYFVGRTIYILNCIDIYRFTPVSGCVGMGLSSLLCPGAYDAAKTASRIIIYIFNSGFVCTYSLACSINTELSSLKNKIPTDWYDDISTLVCCFGHEA